MQTTTETGTEKKAAELVWYQHVDCGNHYGTYLVTAGRYAVAVKLSARELRSRIRDCEVGPAGRRATKADLIAIACDIGAVVSAAERGGGRY